MLWFDEKSISRAHTCHQKRSELFSLYAPSSYVWNFPRADHFFCKVTYIFVTGRKCLHNQFKLWNIFAYLHSYFFNKSLKIYKHYKNPWIWTGTANFLFVFLLPQFLEMINESGRKSDCKLWIHIFFWPLKSLLIVDLIYLPVYLLESCHWKLLIFFLLNQIFHQQNLLDLIKLIYQGIEINGMFFRQTSKRECIFPSVLH